MTAYVTRDGDTVDYIAFKYYGFTDQNAVEQVLAANPGLADRGPTLPHGVRVELPTLATPTQQKGPRLWT